MVSQKANKQKQSSINFTVEHGNNELLGVDKPNFFIIYYSFKYTLLHNMDLGAKKWKKIRLL
jgi:hypothetical protein